VTDSQRESVGLAARFDVTRVDKQVLAAKRGVAHALNALGLSRHGYGAYDQ